MRTWRVLLGLGVGVSLVSLWSARSAHADEPIHYEAAPYPENYQTKVFEVRQHPKFQLMLDRCAAAGIAPKSSHDCDLELVFVPLIDRYASYSEENNWGVGGVYDGTAPHVFATLFEVYSRVSAAEPQLAKLRYEEVWQEGQRSCSTPADESACINLEEYLLRAPHGRHAKEAESLIAKATPRLRAFKQQREARERAEKVSSCNRCFLMPASKSESIGQWCDAIVSQWEWEGFLSKRCNSHCASQLAYKKCLSEPPTPTPTPTPQRYGQDRRAIDNIKCETGMAGLPDNSCMDRTEVTVSAYAACVKSGKCKPAQTGGSCNAGVAGRENHPINCVDWYQANKYCHAQSVGGSLKHSKYLPMSKQWLSATGWSNNDGVGLYPWGTDAVSSQLCWNGLGNDVGEGNRLATCAVGSYPVGNARGFADLQGNVSEWTFDETTQEPNRTAGERRARQILGLATWYEVDPNYSDIASSYFWKPHKWSSGIGFRCAGSPLP